MKALVRSRYEAAKGGSGRIDPITSGLPRMAVRGRLFLSEHANDIRIRYYKGGLAQRNPPFHRKAAGYAFG